MNLLAVYRKEKKYTQWEIAQMFKVSDVLISHWERGKKIPTNEQLVKLSEILGVGIRTLFPELFGDKIK